MSNKNDRFVILRKKELGDVQSPLRSTQRIKYTCFAVSHKYLLLGATSGGIYVFNRNPCKFLYLIPTKEGAIGRLAISKDERFIAFASVRGSACVLEWDEDVGKSRLINRSLEHNGSIITEMVWAETSNQLFIGDSVGRLSVINVSLCVSKNIFLLPAFVFMQLDSRIVQVSCLDNYLLVSTETWCYICDTSKEHYKQIGSKIREGEYGACFFFHERDVIIYSARPGSRLWEVNLNGTVLSTHQLKKVLATEPTPIVCVDERRLLVPSQTSWPEQTFNFCYLINFLDRFLLTFKSDGIYVIDPISVKVVLWTNLYVNIVSVKCVLESIYIWTSTGDLHCFDALQIKECLLQLYYQESFPLCLELCETYLNDFKTPVDFFSLSPLLKLREFIPNDKKRLLQFFDQLKKYNSNSPVATKLDSGIFMVENRHWKKWKVAENRNSIKVKKLPYFNKTRSLPHDLLGSRQRTNSYKMQHTISLPDFQFAIEPLHSESKLDLKLDLNSDKSNILPKIPFLSVPSPEVFHSTISELHQNVSGKFFTGKKTLKSKWHSLEGKLKFSMLQSGFSLDSHNEWKETTNNKPFNGDINKDIKEEVAYEKPVSKNNKNKIDLSDIIDCVNIISKTEDPKKDIIFKLFDSIIDKYNKMAQDTKYNNSKGKFVFPFNELFLEESKDLIKGLFHNCIKNGLMFLYLESLTEERTEKFDLPGHPQLLTEIYTAHQLKLDCYLKNILFIFSELIDPFNILDNLEKSKVPCVFHCWSTILDTFQESALNYITSDQSNNGFEYKTWPLPLLLNTIFLMFRLQQVESSYHMSTESALKFYHISFLILKLSLHFESTGMPKEERDNTCNRLLLKYVTKMLESNHFKIDYMFDYSVSFHLESAFLKFLSPKIPICACGHPICEKQKAPSDFNLIGKLLLYIHLVQYNIPNYRVYNNDFQIFHNSSRPEEIYLLRLVSDYINYKNIKPKEDLHLDDLRPQIGAADEFSFVEKFGKIMKLLQALPELFTVVMKCTVKSIHEIVPFVIQYGASDELNSIRVPMDEHFWTSLCDSNVNYSKGMCCICMTPFSQHVEVEWNNVAMTMLKSLFATKTLSLLKNYSTDISAESLDIRFFRACILSSVLTSTQSKNQVNILRNYYYNITDSVAQELSEESDLLLLEDLPQYTPSVVQTKDSNRWGIQVDVNLDVCGRCAIVLNSKNLAKDGLRAFKCGHIYHTICLRLAGSDFRCSICLNS